MYFKDRLFAGKELATRLAKYTDDDAVVATLTAASEIIGETVAKQLRITVTTLISKAITLPGESFNLGSVDQTGHFSYNTSLTAGEANEYASDYHSYIESEKINKTHEINRVVVAKGLYSRSEFTDKIIILVNDGLDDTVILDSAIEYLKPIRLKKLVMAVPVASVRAVDRMHITCDEIHILSVTENYLSTNHYYDDTRQK